MAFTRALRAVVGAALAGGLVLAVSPTASADQARDSEWALQQWKVPQHVWPITTGAGQKIALIDSGVNAKHVDLVGQVLPGKDYIDPADKGLVDHDPIGSGHGSQMAAVIAGHGHGPGDADGIKGLAPGAKILPIAIHLQDDSSDAASHNDVASAIRWAVDHHATVISMSFAGSTPAPDEEAAVAYAEQHNVVLVAGAGNDGMKQTDYPSGYPGVISVGGLTKADTVWSGETYGHVTVVAPAENIVGANNGSTTQYGSGTGTSPATAYVSALAALIRAKFPNLTAGQVVNRIIKSAGEPKGIKAPDAHWGYGVILPHAALTEKIPAGPASGPLPQAKAVSSQPGGNAAAGSGSSPGSQAVGSKSSSTGVVIGVLVGLVVLVAVIVVIVLLVRRRNRNSGGGSSGSGGSQQPPYPPYPTYGEPQQSPQGGGYQPPAGTAGGPAQSVYQNNPYAQPQPHPQPQQPPYGNLPGGGNPPGR